MRHFITTFLIGMIVLITAGCGFHLRGTTQVPGELRTLILDTSDPYGPMTRVVRQQLRLNNITLVNNDGKNSALPTLRLLSVNEGRDTASVYQNGVTAEYSMVMTVNAQLLLPGKGLYPISTSVYRTFFDNPQAALAKDAEQEIIRQEMRQRAAEQLVRQFLSIHAAVVNQKATLPVDNTPAPAENTAEVPHSSAVSLQ